MAEKTALLARVPPQSLDAERSVLGAMLLDKEAIPKVIELIHSPDTFYSEIHQRIYQSVCGLYERSQPVDLVTLGEELRRQGVLEKVGGAPYLADLIASVTTTSNVDAYARIVREKQVLRDLLRATGEISELAYQDSNDLNTILDQAQSRIFHITLLGARPTCYHIKDVLTGTFERVEALYDKKEHVTGIPTGFRELNDMTSGLQPSDLVIVAGRPSMGKTALALNIAHHAGVEYGLPSVIFSLESGKEQIVERLLCAEARVDSQKLRTGFLSEDDWAKLTAAAGVLAEAPLYIDDSPMLGVMELRARARRLKAEHDIQLVVVDYLQLMVGDRRSESRQQQISEISRFLKALAKELNVPVMAISQLSRAVEQREDKRPRLSDLRESGAIEQDADLVLSLYREAYYTHDEDDEGRAELIINKQRRGPVGRLEMVFRDEYTRFEEPYVG